MERSVCRRGDNRRIRVKGGGGGQDRNVFSFGFSCNLMYFRLNFGVLLFLKLGEWVGVEIKRIRGICFILS